MSYLPIVIVIMTLVFKFYRIDHNNDIRKKFTFKLQYTLFELWLLLKSPRQTQSNCIFNVCEFSIKEVP